MSVRHCQLVLRQCHSQARHSLSAFSACVRAMTVSSIRLLSRLRSSLSVLLLLCCIMQSSAKPCPSCEQLDQNVQYPDRHIYIFVMDSRKGKSLFEYMTPWILSTSRLKESPNVHMIHVGNKWDRKSAAKFYAKPLNYLRYANAAIEAEKAAGRDVNNAYGMLLDSDIFWTNPSLEELFQRYECTRNGRDLVVSTELNCWLGRYCKLSDVQQLYGTTPNAYSVFVNSGAMLGTIQSIQLLLSNITESKDMYFIENGVGRRKYDDQFAVSVYALERPAMVALDIHQRLFATYTMLDHRTNASDVANKNWPFVCRDSDGPEGKILMKCADRTTRSFKSGSIYFDNKKCAVRRIAERARGHSIFPVAETLDNNPVLWHGNGAGKRMFYKHSEKMKQCYLNQLKVQASDYFCAEEGCSVRGREDIKPFVLSNAHLLVGEEVSSG